MPFLKEINLFPVIGQRGCPLMGPLGHTVLNSETGAYTRLTIGDTVAMLIKDNNGSLNVRIGNSTTAGDEKLHVDGNIKATGNVQAAKDADISSYLGKGKIDHFGYDDWVGFYLITTVIMLHSPAEVGSFYILKRVYV
jgi:hypothetical protein